MTLGIGLAILTSWLWGTSNVLARVGMKNLSSTTATLFSLICGFVMTTVIALLIFYEKVINLDTNLLPWLALVGFLQFAIGRFLLFTAVRLAGVSRATPLVGSSPLVATSLAVLFAGERLSVIHAIGIGAIFIGMAIVFIQNLEPSSISSTKNIPKIRPWHDRNILLGSIAALVSAIGFGGNQFISATRIVTETEPLIGAAFTLMFGTAFVSLFVIKDIKKDLKSPKKGFMYMGLSGLSASTGVVVLFTALANAPISVVSPISNTQPMVSILLTHLFLQQLERVTLQTVMGAGLVIAGVVAITLGST